MSQVFVQFQKPRNAIQPINLKKNKEQLPLDSMEKEKNIPMGEDPVLISADQQIETDENNLAKIEIDQENLSNDEEELNEGRVCERMSYEESKNI